jgi:hypothetical protein
MKTKKPILLYVLCSLSAIYLFFGVYSELTYITNKDYFINDYFEEAEEKIAEIEGDSEQDEFERETLKNQVIYRKIDNVNYTRNHASLLFIHIVGLFGVILMFRMNYKGLGLYLTYIVLDLSFRSATYSEMPNFNNFLIMNALLSLAFAGAYYSVFYKLKKQNNNA